MFTGIVEHRAKVKSLEASRLVLHVPFSTKDIHIGQSIAVNGCCLTVVDIQDQLLGFDVNPETQTITTLAALKVGQKVNVERALAIGDRLDGHMVSGHIDTKSTITRIEKLGDQQSYEIDVALSADHRPYVLPKGSIAIDGISLTINRLEDRMLTVCIIAHTWQHTNLSDKKVGDSVNIEFDMMAKQISQVTKQYLAHHMPNNLNQQTKEPS
jgi:riboflavin synthase